MLATVRQVPVLGFQISHGMMEPLSLNFCPGLLPPMTSTSPLGKTTVFTNWRGYCIDAVGATVGGFVFMFTV